MSARQQANLELCERFYQVIFGGDWDFIGRNITFDTQAIAEAFAP